MEDEKETFESLIKYLKNPEYCVCARDIVSILENPEDAELLKNKMDLTTLLDLILVLARATDNAEDFHNDENEEAHMKHIQKRIFKLEGRLNNHRHETSKTYGTKPTF